MNFKGKLVEFLFSTLQLWSLWLYMRPGCSLWMWISSKGSIQFQRVKMCMLGTWELFGKLPNPEWKKSGSWRGATAWNTWKDDICTQDRGWEERNPSTTWYKLHSCSHRRFFTAFCPETQSLSLGSIYCLSLWKETVHVIQWNRFPWTSHNGVTSHNLPRYSPGDHDMSMILTS
jgi:hypothetical protein